MATFEYSALDTSGKPRSGVLSAANERAARTMLERRRLLPLRIDGSAQPAQVPPRTLGARRERISGSALTLVTRQLATLVRVVTIEEALRTLAMQTESASARRVLLATHTAVLEGFRLSDAMARQRSVFPALYRAMIAAGENSGALPQILERLADTLEREQQTRSKLLTTLIYPAVLAVVALTVIAALMGFVVPKVVEQFDSMGQTLPLLTRIVIFLSDLARNWGWLVLLLVAGLSLVGARLLRDERIRFAADTAVLRLPFLGRLLRDVHAARLARTLSTMLASGLPVVEGLTLAAPTTGNLVLRRATMDMAASIREGGSLSAAMRRANVFPPVLIYMTASGESSGRLEAMLTSAAEYLEREFHTVTSVALSLLEPIIIVVMGAVVATIVLSILLPILQINTLAAG
jgi:general secretion pathway protein F